MNASTLLSQFVTVAQSDAAVVLIKSTLVFTAALFLLSLARRLSASLRHRIASVTFAVALLLPLAAAFTPARVFTLRVADPPRVAATAPAAAPSQVTSGTNTSPARRPSMTIRPLTIIRWTYVAGVAFFLISLAGGIFRLHRLRQTADVYVAGTRLANELAAKEGMRGGIEVFISSQLAVPMTCGTRHPAILLPEEIRAWDPPAVQRALRHELEHIVRRDWLTQVFSRLACALYWPHPMVWMLWSRLRLEAERACDDAVLRSGSAGESYAEQLVDLARRIASHGTTPALAMATRSNLGRRVEAILDRSLRRSPLSTWASGAVTLTAAALLLGIAPLRVVAGPVIAAVNSAGALASEDGGGTRSERTDPLNFALLKVARIGDTRALRSLLASGADANATFRGDGTALIEAARGGHVEALAILIDAGADPNRGVRGDGNPLIAAAQAGHVEAVKYLLDRGADIDRGVRGDGNALIMAAGAGQLDVVKLLVERGASIDAVVPGDENALIHACEGGSTDVVRYLISQHADVNARVWSEYGNGASVRGEWRTPLVMARRQGHAEIMQILLSAGAKE